MMDYCRIILNSGRKFCNKTIADVINVNTTHILNCVHRWPCNVHVNIFYIYAHNYIVPLAIHT